jgi:hypothetical protein
MSLRPRRPLLLTALSIAILAGGGVWLWRWQHRAWRPSNADVLAPRVALAAVQGPKTYGNAPARSWLEKERPTLLPEPAHDPRSTFSRGMTQAVQDPRLFRELDRQVRFDEVWLLGDVSSYKPLLDHLIETHDFTLTWIDHTGLLFRREGESWSQAKLEAMIRQFADRHERAYVQALCASKFVALHQGDAAAKLLQQAEAAATDVPEVWSGWSTYYMAQAKWDKALDAADRALALDRDSPPGIACRAQCLYATKRFSEAWHEAERLLAQRPDDPAMLFYHAKLAHEAHAYQSETESLRKLIALAEAAKANVSGYRVYLAQSYAAQSDADNAMDQVTLALLDTTLPREQRQFADELLGQIQRAIAQAAAKDAAAAK